MLIGLFRRIGLLAKVWCHHREFCEKSMYLGLLDITSGLLIGHVCNSLFLCRRFVFRSLQNFAYEFDENDIHCAGDIRQWTGVFPFAAGCQTLLRCYFVNTCARLDSLWLYVTACCICSSSYENSWRSTDGALSAVRAVAAHRPSSASVIATSAPSYFGYDS